MCGLTNDDTAHHWRCGCMWHCIAIAPVPMPSAFVVWRAVTRQLPTTTKCRASPWAATRCGSCRREGWDWQQAQRWLWQRGRANSLLDTVCLEPVTCSGPRWAWTAHGSTCAATRPGMVCTWAPGTEHSGGECKRLQSIDEEGRARGKGPLSPAQPDLR